MRGLPFQAERAGAHLPRSERRAKSFLFRMPSGASGIRIAKAGGELAMCVLSQQSRNNGSGRAKRNATSRGCISSTSALAAADRLRIAPTAARVHSNLLIFLGRPSRISTLQHEGTRSGRAAVQSSAPFRVRYSRSRQQRNETRLQLLPQAAV